MAATGKRVRCKYGAEAHGGIAGVKLKEQRKTDLKSGPCLIY